MRARLLTLAVGVLRAVLAVTVVSTHAFAQAVEDAHPDSDGAPIDYTAARAALQDVLAHREFQRRDMTEWSDQFQRWVYDWVRYLLDTLFGTETTPASVARGLAWIIAIGALAALVVWALRMRRSPGASRPLAIAVVPRLTSRQWTAKARAALRDGDAREALRCGYHAVLFRLEEQGVWRVDDSRTPREYLSLLTPQDARHAALVDLTREFEQVWYAARPTDGRGLLERLEVFGCHAPSEPAI